jgi:DNA-binding PadR family transcriptional regulator
MTTRITELDYAVLGLLCQVPRSGYDLRKIFETMAIGSYSGSPGAIYPALRRLEQAGLVDGKVDTRRALRPKKIFRPTRDGRNALSEWLARDITREDVERNLDELLLRFAFHWILDDAKATRRFLETLLDEVECYLAELNRQLGLFPEGAPPHARLALAAGIEQYRACARWARKALKEFEEE